MTPFRSFLPLVFGLLSILTSTMDGAEPEVLFLEFHTAENVAPQISLAEELFVASAVKWKTVSLCDLENQKITSEAGRVLLVCESENFPAGAVSGLEAYLKSGGNVLFIGGDRPFTASAVRDGDRMVTYEAFIEKLKTDPHGRDTGIIRQDVSYRRHCSAESVNTPATATFLEDEKALSIHIERYFGWDMWATPDNIAAISADTEFLRVKAKGDMPVLAIELYERDNSRWIATFEVKNEWDTCVLSIDDFHIWESPHRGKAGDRVRFDNIQFATIGIADSHTHGVKAGQSYNFAVQSIDALPKVQNSGNRFYPPEFILEGVAPCYKSYKLDGPVTITSGGHRFDFPEAVVSPVPRMTGLGIDMNRPWRFIPVATARNEAGGRGYPAWIMLHLDRQYKSAAVAGMGFSLETILKEQNLSAILVDLAKRLGSGTFLAGAGASDFLVDVGSPFRFGAEPFKIEDGMKVRAVIRNPDGTIVAGFEKPIAGNDAVTDEATLNTPGTYRCTVELKDAQNRVVDEIESEIVVDDGKPDPASAFIRVEKDNFVLEGGYWYPNGVNFFPIYTVSGMDTGDFGSGWGDRRLYDPVLLEDSILDAKSAGINMLSVLTGFERAINPQSLRDFLYRSRKHGMKVNLFVGAASPLDFQEEMLRRFIEDARLRDNATLFCYDIIWEPTNYIYAPHYRERFRPEWNRWLEGQYGNKEDAVKNWKFDPGSNENGLFAPPTDEQFRTDGDHRVFVAVYRRFMDDHTARLWQRAVDKLRRLDPNHLITNRAGNIHPYDNAFTGPVKALDFISPEGYSIQQNEVGEGAIGFATRLIDFYSGGKPVVWSEFGRPVHGANFLPMAASMDESGTYNEIFYRRGLEAGAQGFAPWWWPGGYRVDERSDFGISNVDGTLRRAAEVVKRYASQIETPRKRPVGTVPFDFDPDEHAGGYPALVFGKGGKAYLDAASEGKMLS
ncbi:MAG: beta-galactosidase, partial [Planctomycetaceae bacterium]|nr:beta-galactosidase [Planctomycetaceae bacterium]